MSILITGIDMPTGNEMLCINIFPDGKVTNHFNLRCAPVAKSVPVPPHGDLIDRKQLIKSDHQHYEYMSDEFYVTVRDIENAPTIIPAEESE